MDTMRSLFQRLRQWRAGKGQGAGDSATKALARALLTGPPVSLSNAPLTLLVPAKEPAPMSSIAPTDPAQAQAPAGLDRARNGERHGPGPEANGSGLVVGKDRALLWLRQMELVRRFEERSAMLYQAKEIFGFLHLYSGQEPVAIGSIGALRDDDYVITAYRDHAHALVRGMSPRSGMCEMMGKAPGCAKGKGGSMHFFQADHNFLGGHAIVGGHVPLAAGAAWASQYLDEGRVCICYFGDGAMNQGPVHEAFNMAAMWKLPVIWVMENNQYSMGTCLERSSAILDFTIRGGTAYGTPGITIDASDVEEVARTVHEAAERARAGKGPTFIEMLTYRYRGHSMADPGRYRSNDEIEDRRKRDPIEKYATELKKRGWIDEAAHEAMREEIKEEIDEAIEYARSAPSPSLDEIYTDVTVGNYRPQESSGL